MNLRQLDKCLEETEWKLKTSSLHIWIGGLLVALNLAFGINTAIFGSSQFVAFIYIGAACYLYRFLYRHNIIREKAHIEIINIIKDVIKIKRRVST